MSRKRGKKQKAAVEAVPVDILAEGSGPLGRAEADVIATVEQVVTTEDIATTEDVVTADDVVAAGADPGISVGDSPSAGREDDAGLRGLAPDELSPGGDEDAASAAADVVSREATSPEVAEFDATGADGASFEDTADGGNAGEGEGEGEGDEDDAAIVFPTSAATMDAGQFKHLVEALVFASDRPLTVQRLRQLTRVGDVRRLEGALAEITEDYRERGLILQQVSGGYQFRTRTQFSAWVQQLIAGRPVRLSRAQLETLAIIAYRQPITRPEIDDIRGVDSTATLKLLIDRMLIRVLGKREEVGRPMLYGTTKEFLDFFSLGDLRELPTLREYSELTAESRKVMSDRLGLAADDDGSGGPGDGGGGDGGGDDDGGDGGGAGGEGGGGPIPGFGDGGVPGTGLDDGGEPANATASDLADALATFFSAADAVEQSNAAAVAEPEGHAPVDDEIAEDEVADGALADELAAGELAAGALADELAAGALAAGALAGELAADEVAANEVAANEVAAGEPAGELAADELAANEVAANEVAAGGIAVDEADDPVGPGVMASDGIGADALDEGRGGAASAATFHAEPAVE